MSLLPRDMDQSIVALTTKIYSCLKMQNTQKPIQMSPVTYFLGHPVYIYTDWNFLNCRNICTCSPIVPGYNIRLTFILAPLSCLNGPSAPPGGKFYIASKIVIDFKDFTTSPLQFRSLSSFTQALYNEGYRGT